MNLTKININNQCKMVVDGHWFARSRYAIVRKDNPECTFMVNIERDKKLLMTKMTMDLYAYIRELGSIINQVIIASDYVSWRKQLKYLNAPWIPESEFDESYKSQREYDEEVNWEAINNCTSEWARLLEKHFNMPYLKVHGAEADDLMYITKLVLNSAGENALLFATDADTSQNIALNENGSFTAMYKRIKGNKYQNYVHQSHLIAPRQVIEMVNANSVHDVFTYDPNQAYPQDKYKEIFNVLNDEVHPPAFVLEKIVLGDKKDNIFPIMYRKKKQISKPQPRDLKKAVELLGVRLEKLTFEHLYDEKFIEGVLNYIHDTFMKMETMPADYKKFYMDKYKQNRALVFLSTKEIPMVVVDKMKDAIREKTKMILGKTNILNAQNFHEVLQIIGVQDVSQQIGKQEYIDPFADLTLIN